METDTMARPFTYSRWLKSVEKEKGDRGKQGEKGLGDEREGGND